MFNKVIVGILIILLLITGGMGYYSFTLNRQLDRLDEKLTTLEAAQTARMDAVSGQIGELREETLGNFETLQGQLEKSASEIGDLNEKMAEAGSRITGLEEKTDSLSSNITDLTGRVGNTEKKLSADIIDAGDVFTAVSRVTVRITDGQSVIGSGFAYDAEGHVITAYHVIEELSPIYVIMDDGTFSLADITGFSEYSDVAVLKLVNNRFSELPSIGDSGMLEIGEPVVTIGSPGDSSQALGLRDTLTAGIVSQLNRYVEVDGNWVSNMIQFDAPVNYGNSGGPLANSNGEIIGLITARIDPMLGDGIYYAVASNKFKRVADAIIADGYFPYPWIGVSIRNINPEEARDKGLETINGVLVVDVMSGSPAQAAGILPGDIIIAEDNMTVKDVDELVSYLGEFGSPGEELILSIMRGITTLEITVKVGTRLE